MAAVRRTGAAVPLAWAAQGLAASVLALVGLLRVTRQSAVQRLAVRRLVVLPLWARRPGSLPRMDLPPKALRQRLQGWRRRPLRPRPRLQRRQPKGQAPPPCQAQQPRRHRAPPWSHHPMHAKHPMRRMQAVREVQAIQAMQPMQPMQPMPSQHQLRPRRLLMATRTLSDRPLHRPRQTRLHSRPHTRPHRPPTRTPPPTRARPANLAMSAALKRIVKHRHGMLRRQTLTSRRPRTPVQRSVRRHRARARRPAPCRSSLPPRLLPQQRHRPAPSAPHRLQGMQRMQWRPQPHWQLQRRRQQTPPRLQPPLPAATASSARPPLAPRPPASATGCALALPRSKPSRLSRRSRPRTCLPRTTTMALRPGWMCRRPPTRK